MISVIQTDVPRCPECSTLMFFRTFNNHMYYCCPHCSAIHQILDGHQSDNEVIVSSNKNDIYITEDE